MTMGTLLARTGLPLKAGNIPNKGLQMEVLDGHRQSRLSARWTGIFRLQLPQICEESLYLMSHSRVQEHGNPTKEPAKLIICGRVIGVVIWVTSYKLLLCGGKPVHETILTEAMATVGEPAQYG